MSILAGIVCTRQGVSLEDGLCDKLKEVVSRFPGEEVRVFRDRRAFLLKADVGAFGQPAFHIAPNGSVAMLAGAPLVSPEAGRSPRSRATDLELLHKSMEDGDFSMLSRTRGQFCIAHYRPDTAAVTLSTDKLGLRSLYYWAGESYFIFASALRILEALPQIPKIMDLGSVIELSSMGWPLNHRTPYKEIAVLEPAEIKQCSGGDLRSHRYWRWDTISVSKQTEAEILTDTYERFKSAVAIRLQGETTTAALLSGGLDSRCVVAALGDQGARVHTYNFARKGTQDKVFAHEFAQRIGTMHHELDLVLDVLLTDADTIRMLTGELKRVNSVDEWRSERPALVWTGDGGSVLLGHVFMSAEVVSLLREHKPDQAIEHFLRAEKRQVLSRLLHPRVARELSGILREEVRESLNRIQSEDPGRGLYFFLLNNSPRRAIAQLWENIDLLRIDFQMPLYDSDLLEAIVAMPIDLGLCHRFYSKWLALFDPSVSSVPWQTYPGHEACPLPFPPQLVDQWNQQDSAKERSAVRDELLRRSGEMLNGGGFPSPILNRRYLQAVWWTHRLRLRDYGYALRVALLYSRYWSACGGRYKPT